MPLASLILGFCALVAAETAPMRPVSYAALAQESAPPQTPPPSASPQETPQQPAQSDSPPETSKPAEPQAQPEQEQAPKTPPAAQPSQTPQPSASSEKAAAATSPAAKKRRRKHKRVSPPSDVPTKRVIRNGSAADPTVQLAPGLTQEQAVRQRQSTAQLLTSTEGNLKTLAGRQLSPNQREIVKQIRMYMDQAKAAGDTQDLERARNLAFKARLLSDDLLRH